MFSLIECKFGKISWYYHDIAREESPADMSGNRYTPVDLVERWIINNNKWGENNIVREYGHSQKSIQKYCDQAGVVLKNIYSSRKESELNDGAYILGSSDEIYELIADDDVVNKLQSVKQGGDIFVGLEVAFASNMGFEKLRGISDLEEKWLNMNDEVFSKSKQIVPYELIKYSPLVLTRLICERLNAGKSEKLKEITIQNFVFDQDVLTPPLGHKLKDEASAMAILERRVSTKTDRSGAVCLAFRKQDAV